jgi:hypothetical protein
MKQIGVKNGVAIYEFQLGDKVRIRPSEEQNKLYLNISYNYEDQVMIITKIQKDGGEFLVYTTDLQNKKRLCDGLYSLRFIPAFYSKNEEIE